MDKLGKILKEDAVILNQKVDFRQLLGKHIILTGASGLIGINFLMSLKELTENHAGKKPPSVTAIFYNNIPGYLRKTLNFKSLTIKKGDLTDQNFIKSLPKADYIIHAAGYAQPGKFLQDKIKTIMLNTGVTISLLQKLKPNGKFLFISSSEVCSGLPNPPYKESQIGTTNTTHPRACYIESKRCGEAICQAYFEKGIDVKTVRPSLIYGPGTRRGDTRVLHSFIEKGLAGKIEMLDWGTAGRTYCYVRDALEIMWDVLLFGTEQKYNVGGFSNTTIADLAEKIGKILKVKVIMPKEENKLAGAPENVSLDMSKAAKEFGKSKKDFVSLNDGLKKTIIWQRELSKTN